MFNFQTAVHDCLKTCHAGQPRGIPVDEHPKYPGKSTLEVILSTLHSGCKFSGKAYATSGGLHGVGVSVVNALSTKLQLEIWRDGGTHVQSYERGKPVTSLEKVGSADKTGTKVTFHPDPEIFTETVYNFDTLSHRLRELAFLNKGLKIVLVDERGEEEERLLSTRPDLPRLWEHRVIDHEFEVFDELPGPGHPVSHIDDQVLYK